MPDIVALKSDTHATLITFPQCALGAVSQKYTTLLVSDGLSPSLQSLANLCCQHATHASLAGGSKTSKGWTSRQHSAYPPDLNFLFARVIATHLHADNTVPRPHDQLPESRQTPPTELAAPSPPSAISAPPPAPVLDTTPPVSDATHQRDSPQQAPFKRALGPYPLRSRGAALMALRAR
eukprot:5937284-Pleurochrysis_carterae.AAC.1